MYVASLRRMTPEQRLFKAPELDERDLHQLYVARLEKCRRARY
jgi:hypothetical protein